MFHELFDGTLGVFKGVKVDFKIITGHEKYLKVFPVAKVPHGIKVKVIRLRSDYAATIK